MLAYHSDPALKAELLFHTRAHREADRIKQGRYWRNGKGCAVGCALESLRIMRGQDHIAHDDHSLLAKMTGIPEELHRLQDCIFEGLSRKNAIMWPERFAAAATPGADLSRVVWKFLHWLLTDEGINPGINYPTVKQAIANVALIMADMIDNRPGRPSDWADAADVAWAVAWETRIPAREAAIRAAAWAAEALVQGHEARAEGRSPEARNALWIGATSKPTHAVMAVAGDRRDVWVILADKLIEMMTEAT